MTIRGFQNSNYPILQRVILSVAKNLALGGL